MLLIFIKHTYHDACDAYTYVHVIVEGNTCTKYAREFARDMFGCGYYLRT